MATSITAKYLNQDKRETEAVTVTLPAILEEGGGRANTAPVYVQGGEQYNAAVTPKEAVFGKTYLVIEEAFPSGATVTVSVAGEAMFTDVDATVVGLTTSTTEDVLKLTGGNVAITIGDVTGEVTSGKLKVIANYTPYTIKNGRFSDVPVV